MWTINLFLVGAASPPRSGSGKSRRGRRSYQAMLAGLGLLLLAGCDMQDMYQQPKQQPLQSSGFYADQRSARPLVADTVARGQLRTDTVYFAGMRGTNFVSELPRAADRRIAAARAGAVRYFLRRLP